MASKKVVVQGISIALYVMNTYLKEKAKQTKQIVIIFFIPSAAYVY